MLITFPTIPDQYFSLIIPYYYTMNIKIYFSDKVELFIMNINSLNDISGFCSSDFLIYSIGRYFCDRRISYIKFIEFCWDVKGYTYSEKENNASSYTSWKTCKLI